MMFRIIPDYIWDELNRRLDAEIEKCPEAAPDREVLFRQLVDHVDAHGEIPDFSLAPKSA